MKTGGSDSFVCLKKDRIALRTVSVIENKEDLESET